MSESQKNKKDDTKPVIKKAKVAKKTPKPREPKKPLELFKDVGILECGLDETGLGCLCGPVFAGAVIWPQELDEAYLNAPEYAYVRDSKKLTAKQRDKVYNFIKEVAVDYAVVSVDSKKVDEMGIYQARFLAMRMAVEKLSITPDKLLVDGNAFIEKDLKIPFETIIKGDGIYQSIAAASILAKCDRDAVMQKLHSEYPVYGWDSNKGYPTKKHKEALKKYGITPYHRTSYKLGVCKIQHDDEDM
jgi:ribonuclease HII